MKKSTQPKSTNFNPMKVAGIALGAAVKELNAHMAAMTPAPRRAVPMITGNIKKRR